MPELNLSYAPEPAWLRSQGTGASGFLQDVARVQGIRQEAQTFPLKLRSMQQDAEMNQLKMEEMVRQRDQLLEVEAELPTMRTMVAPLLKARKPLEAMQEILAWGVENPIRLKHPTVQTFLKELGGAVKVEADLRQIELQSDPNSFQNLIRAGHLGLRKEQVDISKDKLAESQANTELRRIGAVQSATQAEAELLKEGFKPAQPLGPPSSPGEVPATRLIPTERPPTTANITEAQQEMNAAVLAVGSISKAIDAVEKNPDAAGAVGWLKELYEGVGGQLGLDPGTRITDTRTYMRDTANQLTAALRVDVGAMSDWEQKLLEAIPGLLDKTASADTIKTRLRIISRLMAGKAFRNAPILRKNPPPALLEALTTEDLADAIKAGYITLERGVQEYDRRKGR